MRDIAPRLPKERTQAPRPIAAGNLGCARATHFAALAALKSMQTGLGAATVLRLLTVLAAVLLIGACGYRVHTDFYRTVTFVGPEDSTLARGIVIGVRQVGSESHHGPPYSGNVLLFFELDVKNATQARLTIPPDALRAKADCSQYQFHNVRSEGVYHIDDIVVPAGEDREVLIAFMGKGCPGSGWPLPEDAVCLIINGARLGSTPLTRVEICGVLKSPHQHN